MTPSPDAESLFLANIRLAYHMANKSRNYAQCLGIAYEDLVADCLLALWRACQRHRPGPACSSYLCTGIWHFLYGSTFATPRRRTGTPLATAIRLDATDAKGHALAETIPDRWSPLQLEDAEELEWLLTWLRPCDRRVVELRFGLNGGREHSLQEIANELGLTKERVRQIEVRILKRMRDIAADPLGSRETSR